MRNTIALAVLTLVVLTLAGAASAREVQSCDLSIGGVVSGDTEANVLAILGEPSQRIDTGEGTDFRYPDLVVTVGWLEQKANGVQRRVVALRGTGPKACTPRGLCPGMAVSEVSRLYGPSDPVQRSYGTFIEYQPLNVGCWLQVAPQAGVIQSLAVACQP